MVKSLVMSAMIMLLAHHHDALAALIIASPGRTEKLRFIRFDKGMGAKNNGTFTECSWSLISVKISEPVVGLSMVLLLIRSLLNSRLLLLELLWQIWYSDYSYLGGAIITIYIIV